MNINTDIQKNTTTLELKKLAFMTWARNLYNQGTITLEECNKALSEYQKMTK